jgi:ABC-type cobalamin/Fe3+-siderophores transport system ATPase subunit
MAMLATMEPRDGTHPRVEVRDLGVVAAGREVLRGVSFDVAAGEVVGVLGPNGSGKTTLLEAIAGLRQVARGTVTVDGRPLRRFRDRAALLAFMPQDDVLPEEATLGVALGLSRDDAAVAAFGPTRWRTTSSGRASFAVAVTSSTTSAIRPRRPAPGTRSRSAFAGAR